MHQHVDISNVSYNMDFKLLQISICYVYVYTRLQILDKTGVWQKALVTYLIYILTKNLFNEGNSTFVQKQTFNTLYLKQNLNVEDFPDI